jgi:carboxyl-terminal processing protease
MPHIQVKMRKNIFLVLVLLLALLYIPGCKKDVSPVPETPVPANIQATNKWIYETMTDYYLWNDYLPSGIDYTKEADPEAYFYKLIYPEKDKWSYITSDYQSLKAELSGTPLTMGYQPVFYLAGTNKVIIAVAYVYPGSAAADAGLERGDIIVKINDTPLDTTNYYTLYSGTNYSVQLGAVIGTSFVSTGESLSMTARVTDTDPSVYYKVLDIDGYKIGYLAYVEFITGNNGAYLATMDNIFDDFKTQGISDLIVDLRYNPGGEVDAALHLASDIAPSSVTSVNEVMISLQYNAALQSYLRMNNYVDYLYYKFENSASNINMSHTFFLTTNRSASASELVITGLKPYMNITQIGEPTYGKYCGSWVIPDDNEEWAMMPIITKFANSQGFTDFVDGLIPDYYIEDELIPALPLGDIADPMIAKAVELATGKSVPAAKRIAPGISGLKEIVPREISLSRSLILPAPWTELKK